LFNTLDSNKPHPGATHRLTNRFGIHTVILVTFNVRFDELSGDELYVIPPLLQFTSPMVG